GSDGREGLVLVVELFREDGFEGHQARGLAHALDSHGEDSAVPDVGYLLERHWKAEAEMAVHHVPGRAAGDAVDQGDRGPELEEILFGEVPDEFVHFPRASTIALMS